MTIQEWKSLKGSSYFVPLKNQFYNKNNNLKNIYLNKYLLFFYLILLGVRSIAKFVRKNSEHLPENIFVKGLWEMYVIRILKAKKKYFLKIYLLKKKNYFFFKLNIHV